MYTLCFHHYFCRQFSVPLPFKLGLATGCPVHIPQLDKFHPVSERATGCGVVRCHVPGHDQNIPVINANGFSSNPGIWTTIFHVTQCGGN